MKKFEKQPPSEFTRHKGIAIGKWLCKEVFPHKDGLSEEQITKLEAMGINWESPETKIYKLTKEHSITKSNSPIAISLTEKEWIPSYVLCKEYIKKFDELPSHEKMYENQPIGTWLEKQIEDSKSGQLSTENFSRLETLLQIAELFSGKKQINQAVAILTRSFSPGEKAFEMKVPEAIAAEIIERLRERKIEPLTQKAGGSEIRIRVENRNQSVD